MTSDTMSAEEDFGARARAVVENYIRTVLLVDDEWPERSASQEPDEALDPSVFDTHEAGAGNDVPAVPPPGTGDGDSLLEIERDVMRRGALFSAIRYSGAGDQSLVVRLARKADIVILDWHLVRGDDGREAREILRALGSSGLKFVCIFTGHGRVDDVKAAIGAALEREPESIDSSGSDFRVGSMIVAIRNKSIDGESGTLAADVFGAAVNAIAEVYSGFVQLGLLELVQRHRDQLPVMLERFGKGIDVAFAYEVTDDDSPIEAGGLFVQMILDEWRASLEATIDAPPMQVMSDPGWESFLKAQHAKLPRVRASTFLEHFYHALGKPAPGQPPPWASKWPDTLARLSKWMIGSFQKEEIVGWPKSEMGHGKWALLRSILGPSHDVGKHAFAPLLEFETLFQEQRQLPTKLTQGTILRCSDASKYLVCTTPLCDAARPDKIQHVFSFVIASSVALRASERKFGCVIHDSGAVVCLHVTSKPVVAFRVQDPTLLRGQPLKVRPWIPGPASPPAQETPQAVSSGPTPPDTIELTPVSQLRAQHALALVEIVNADASRVGLDRVEFVRRYFDK